MKKIKVGIVGYGNIGKGVERALAASSDMELAAVFTRRDPSDVKIATAGVKVLCISEAEKMKDDIDVMILCGGSATDLPEQGSYFASMFNTVDSYDTHAKIPEYLASVDAAAKNTTSIISTGWDPGLFSFVRLISGVFLPVGNTYSFWGKGVSQGHSDAIRRVDGVINAVQYTIPVDSAVEAVRSGANPSLKTGEKHIRECFVVVADGADKMKIESEIKNMPNYFSDYQTTVHYISEQELIEKHNKMPHGGFVIRSGETGENKHIIELSIKLDSNPEFTSNIIVAYARAAVKMAELKMYGAKTVFDVPPIYLSPVGRDELIKELL